ncbi:sulfatase-like hydrolase/transferase [Coraliomargarita akajimensis]|nr:sulfatase-like hydrolase/transferase [Coraliomargarita akajimensis]
MLKLKFTRSLYRSLLLAPLLAASSAFGEKPNILWIITDDQRADSLACFNQAELGQEESRLGYVHSPNIDRLAADGVLFTQAYCNSPVCGSTRASMHMGSYPHHTGRYAFERSHQRSDISRITIPQVMRVQGYRTASFGKSGHLIAGDLYETEVDASDLKKNGLTDFTNSTKRKPGVWDATGIIYNQENFHKADGSMDTFFSHKADGFTPAEQKQKDDVEARYEVLRAYTRQLETLIVGGESSQPPEKTLDGEILNAYNRYLDNTDKSYETPWGEVTQGPVSKQPLFVHLSFHLPHTPVLAPKKFREIFKDKVYAIPEYSKTEMNRQPEWVRQISIKMNFEDMTAEDKQQAIRDYYAFCAFGDDLIGRAAERFKAFSEAQGRDWMILYVAGDHGWHLGEQGIHAKFAPWLSSTRGAVVLTASDKSLYPAGTHCDTHVEYVDFATTFYKTAGVLNAKEQYPHLDGLPLDETLHGSVPARPYVWAELNHVTGPWASMRTKDFMFGMKTRPYYNYPPAYEPNQRVRWALDAPIQKVEPVLYDLRVDGAERVNLAEVPEYAELVEWFRQKVGNIALGDGRVEVNWKADNEYAISNFAEGADDKQLDIPPEIIPGPEYAETIFEREFRIMLSGN